MTEIIYTPIKQNATRTAALLSGEVDFVLDPPAQDLDRLRKQAKVLDGNEYRTIYIGLDVKSPELKYSNVKGKNPLHDIRVREALYRAIDIEAIRKSVMRGMSLPTGTMIAPQVAGYTPELGKRVPYDPEKARALLKEAGYDNNFELTLDCPNNRYINDEAICQAILAMWAKVGVKGKLNAMPRAKFFPKVANGDTSAYLFGWGVPTFDAYYSLEALIHSKGEGANGAFNYGNYSNPEIDKLIDAVKVETDDAKRTEMIHQALALFASALDHHVQAPQARTIVQSMKISLRGMEEMFDSLMDMSKLDAGVMRAEPQVFLINDIFQQLESTYGPQAEAAGLELRLVPSSAAVRSDPRLLARILGNFLSNAIRYTRHGSILMGVRHHGDSVSIAVHDTGPGIPDSQRLDIFREFHQGNGSPSGRGVGMGLGLAIVQRLARLLNHRVDVRSVVGRGSCFAVAVPLSEDWSPVPGGAEEDAEEEVRDVVGATVVVVDDDPEIQEGLGMILADWGCQAVVADNADQALSALAHQHLNPDVILADLHLHARGDGISAIRAIRSGTGRQVPAFLFTGDTEAPIDAAASGFRILRKPLDPLRLRTLLADALGR